MRLGIHNKITLIYTLLTAGILIGCFLFLNNQLSKKTYTYIEDDLKKQLDTFTSIYLHKQKQLSFDYIAREFSQNTSTRVTIIDKTGKVITDSDKPVEEISKMDNHINRPEVQEALHNNIGKSTRFSHTVKKNMLYMAKYVKGETEHILRLSVPLSYINEVNNQTQNTLAISLIIATILAYIASWLLYHTISDPIIKLARVAENISNGNDNIQHINYSSNDEIGDLSNSINEMSKKINQKINEVTKNKSRLEAVFQSMFDGILITDNNGTIKIINHPLKEILNINYEVKNKNVIEIIRNIELNEIIQNITSNVTDFESREILITQPTEKYFIVNANPITANDTVVGAVVTFHDITKIKQLEKIRQDFVANVSHELRTPTASILGFTETLIEGAINDKEAASEFLETIHKDAKRLSALINDLLNLAKIESDEHAFIPSKISIEDITNRALSSLSPFIKQKELTINKNFEQSYIYGEESRIEQVVLNLIDNAIKYNVPKGSITISCIKEKQSIKYSVSDTGIGVPTEDLPRLFERFYRVDKARSREIGGTGLGLSIVKNIIIRHNGAVFAESNNVGSTFYFTLPLS